MYNVQLKENFKIFIGGPSRCGKTTFVVDLIQNLSNLAVVAPTFIIYIYKVWQPIFDEMNKVNVFLQDGESIDSRIKSYANGQPILVIFDDLISSKFLNDIAPLFTVDARHLNISLIFLSQRLYVNDEHFRQFHKIVIISLYSKILEIYLKYVHWLNKLHREAFTLQVFTEKLPRTLFPTYLSI